MSVLLILIGLNLFLWGWVWVVPTFAFTSKWLSKRAKGVAPFPGIVIVGSLYKNDPDVLAHELHHQVQMKRYSPLVLFVMLVGQYVIGLILGKRGLDLYHSVAIEAEAFKMMYKPITQRYIKFYR